MPGLFDSYIYGQDKRAVMRKTPVFERIEDLIYKEDMLPARKTGDCNFMLRKFADSSKETPTWLQWESLYFSSGNHRTELLKKSGKRSTYQLEEYYGRTQEELFNLSRDTYQMANEKIHLTPQAWLNVIYIMVIDKPYEEFMRVINAQKSLSSLYNGIYEFDMADPITSREQAVDFFMYSSSTKDMEGGIRVLSDKYRSKLLSPDFNDIRIKMEEKHELFRQSYNLKVFLVFSETNGKITVHPPF